jgi:hypothetical protein
MYRDNIHNHKHNNNHEVHYHCPINKTVEVIEDVAQGLFYREFSR